MCLEKALLNRIALYNFKHWRVSNKKINQENHLWHLQIFIIALVPKKLAEAIWTCRPKQINKRDLPSAFSEMYSYCCGALCIQISKEIIQISLGLLSVKTLRSISQTCKNVTEFLGFLEFVMECFRAGLKLLGLLKTWRQGLKLKLVLIKCVKLAGLAVVAPACPWNNFGLYATQCNG